MNRLEALLPTFPTTTWQWIDIDSYGLSPDDVASYAWLITPHRQFAGHLAFSALLRMQPVAGLRFLGHLMATPPFSWIAAAGYSFIAANRHRLPEGRPRAASARMSAVDSGLGVLPTRRRLWAEVLIVLGLSLGASFNLFDRLDHQ